MQFTSVNEFSQASSHLTSHFTEQTRESAPPVNLCAQTRHLEAVLRMQRDPREPISEYFNRHLPALEAFHNNPEAVRICLHRFCHGLSDLFSTDYLTNWLNTSDWSLQSVRDCLVLLNTAQYNTSPNLYPTVEDGVTTRDRSISRRSMTPSLPTPSTILVSKPKADSLCQVSG